MTISAAYPFEDRYVTVSGVRIHYVEQGSGDPIVFLHGNPTSSYLWRNILPITADKGRSIALDHVGFGKSDKPDIAYSLAEHIRFFAGFVEALALRNVTLVVHDWGGPIALDYAVRNPDNVKAVVAMETVLHTVTWDEFPERARDLFKTFRTPELGWKVICEQNVFVERVLPGSILRKLSDEEMNQYRMPFPTVESRKPVWTFPNQIPIDDRKDEAYRIVEQIEKALPRFDKPVLLLTFTPGALIQEQGIAWAKANVKRLTHRHLGEGVHFVQEDQPEAIGRAIVESLR